jgi:glycosyltransferase involved in cell wall biosynthesis
MSRAALTEIPREDQLPRRTLIIVENISATTDQQLWSEATALCRAGYEVSVICPKRRSTDNFEVTIDGIRVFRHPLALRTPAFLRKLVEYPMALFWEFVISIKIARRYGFDVVHICNPPNIVFLIGAIYRIVARKSIVFDYRDAGTTGYKETLDKHGSLMERVAFRTSDLVLANNAVQRKIAINRGGIPPEKVIVIRPCPDLERVKRRTPDPLWRNGRAHMVSYAGGFGMDEGVDIFISSIEYIVHGQQRADIQFVIAGSGSEWHEIATLCGKKDLSEYVTFTGLIDDETLFTILSTADVCVDPGRATGTNSNSTSQKIMEYMAIGKPIVQFDRVEGRLVAQEASRYALPDDPIDFGNHILELLDNSEMRDIMGDFGQRRAKREFSWHREQKKLLSAYEAVFASREQRLERLKQLRTRKTDRDQVSSPNNSVKRPPAK